MKYIVAVDQSTSASKAFLVDERGEIARRASRPHRIFYPAPGRVEQDAGEILRNVVAIIDEVTEGIAPDQLAALALTNQRETAVLWDRGTGEPVCRAVVWQDTRGEALCAQLGDYGARVRKLTGSDLSPYLPASKIGVLLREDPSLRRRAEAGELCMGTMESFLCFRLGGKHVSDVSNASRTQLMDIHALAWSEELLSLFGIPRALMADILPCDGDFGSYRGMPITGVLGDSFATLFGQGCHAPGMAKISYGTGTSVMVNLGERVAIPKGGLTAAVAWCFGGRTAYELEGNITCSGDTLTWLCEGLQLFRDPGEIEALARTVPDALGVQLVPALAGLGAPFFDTGATALIRGMTRGVTRAHVARAALEGMAQRPADVIEAIRAETGFPIAALMADGGGSKNTLLMQLQADLADCELRCARFSELSALGAAWMAGLATGVYRSFDDIPARQGDENRCAPRMSAGERENLRAAWRRAIECARLR